MIIISQDKSLIINFDKVEMIGTNPDNKKQLFCTFDNGAEELGTYETEERAKEVMQEIAIADSDFKYYAAEHGKRKTEIGIKRYQIYKNIDLYEMPEK